MKYYSFYVGLTSDKEQDFRFDDVKIAANNPVIAMYLHETNRLFDKKKRKRVFDFNKDRLFDIYRKVLEYEVTGTTKSMKRFKLVATYNVSYTLFKEFG
jgi:hypothetical protein